MNISFGKTVIVGGMLLLSSLSALGQDLIARQAPIDRKLRAADSVALRMLRTAERKQAGRELYASSWNNNKVHCYSSEMLPDSFKIDLRGFRMPTTSRMVTSKFGYRPAFRRMHKGLDIKVYTGDTIYAAFSGKIRVVDYERNGYGNFVVIRHNNGLETIYGHLSKHLVGVDQEVRAGEPIGLGGNTGRSFGSHLHFETRLLNEAIDPALLFDFAAQDITGDYFVFRKEGGSDVHYATKGYKHDDEESIDVAAATTSEYTPSRFHKVQAGESLTSIAAKLGISMETLCRANRMTRTSEVRPGQILRY